MKDAILIYLPNYLGAITGVYSFTVNPNTNEAVFIGQNGAEAKRTLEAADVQKYQDYLDYQEGRKRHAEEPSDLWILIKYGVQSEIQGKDLTAAVS